MPLGAGPNNGDKPSIAALPIVFRQSFVLTGGGAPHQSRVLHGDGLPGINVWALQTQGDPVSVLVQFANGVGLGGNVDWQPIALATALVVGTPTLLNYRLGSRLWRLVITPGATDATLQYRFTGSFS